MKSATIVFSTTLFLTFLVFKSLIITLFLAPLEFLLIFGFAANFLVEKEKIQATEKIINSDKI